MGAVWMRRFEPTRSQSHPSPVTARHDAVDALRAESRYSLMMTDSGAGPDGSAETYRVVIQKPDRISITGGLNVIAIGSTGYFRGASGWTMVRHAGESANSMNAMLVYVDILRRAASATRDGDTYNVAPAEAARLLVTTGLPRFRDADDVALSATVAGGIVTAVSLHVGGSAPSSATTTVDEIGRSPAVQAPPQGRILAG